jgi:hypothetical protein
VAKRAVEMVATEKRILMTGRTRMTLLGLAGLLELCMDGVMCCGGVVFWIALGRMSSLKPSLILVSVFVRASLRQ